MLAPVPDGLGGWCDERRPHRPHRVAVASAPDDVTDDDQAAWYAVRARSDGELPRQDRET